MAAMVGDHYTDEVTEQWVSDKESFFAHLPYWSWASIGRTPHRHTKCGITLQPIDLDANALVNYAVEKPRCSACADGVRVTMG